MKRVLESDESTPSPAQSPPYKESNDNTSAIDDDDGGDGGSQYHIAPFGGGTQFTCEKHNICYSMFTITLYRSLIVYLIFSGEADFTHTTQDTDHDAQLSLRVTMTASDRGRDRGGVGNITYPQHIAPLLCIQAVSHPHPMPTVTLNTLLRIHPQRSMMCNGSMSRRIQSSITCWCTNDKQLSHGWGKVGKSTRQAC
jgi:hypothetical protein